MSTLILLKVGGGLISDKKTPQTARPKIISLITEEIKATKATTNFDLVIGTGAGSFGHFTAHEYNLRQGTSTPTQIFGMCKTHAEVAQLNALFVNSLISASAPAFSIAPSAIMQCADGSLSTTNFDTLDYALGHNIIPVLHGDGIPDAVRGMTILSTERILEACLKHLRKNYSRIVVIYLTNELGVLDSNGKLIPELTADASLHVTSTLAHDITGGMLEKVAAARNALSNGATEAYIANGHQKGVLQTILSGAPSGTRIR